MAANTPAERSQTGSLNASENNPFQAWDADICTFDFRVLHTEAFQSMVHEHVECSNLWYRGDPDMESFWQIGTS